MNAKRVTELHLLANRALQWDDTAQELGKALHEVLAAYRDRRPRVIVYDEDGRCFSVQKTCFDNAHRVRVSGNLGGSVTYYDAHGKEITQTFSGGEVFITTSDEEDNGR